MMRTLLLLSLLSVALQSWCQTCPPSVQLGCTNVTGTRLQPANLDFFGGIPFAEPPVGNLRLSPPKPKFSLDLLKSFNATNFGPECLQPSSDLASDANMSEDCLTINIFRPSGTDKNSSLPVMVWIYGGGFLYGSSSLYDGTHLVVESQTRGTPIVYVSFNYRLGPLGFPQGPEAAKRGALNLGLHDQWVALEWVQNNIACFGGDPRKVTIFGESAGAISASYHYLNENFINVARAAIFESGSAPTLPIFDADRGTPSWMLFANNIPSCANATPDNTFSCLMTANASEIVASIVPGLAIDMYPFRPTFDGPGGIVCDLPARRLLDGAGGQVPYIAGTNLDEGTPIIPQDFQIQAIEEWLIANYTPSRLGAGVLKAGMDKVMSLYPDDPSAGSPFGTGNQTFGTGPGYKRGAAIIGDIYFQAQRRFWSQTSHAPSYAYMFIDPQVNVTPSLGVYHTSEVYYLFANVSTGTSNSALLSRTMLDYWISFAVSLTPNDGKGTNRPQWEKYCENKA